MNQPIKIEKKSPKLFCKQIRKYYYKTLGLAYYFGDYHNITWNRSLEDARFWDHAVSYKKHNVKLTKTMKITCQWESKKLNKMPLEINDHQ